MSKVRQFLHNQGIEADAIDMNKECYSFLSEMEKGLEGYGSLAMIPTYISDEVELIYDEKVIVIDAGGSNLRTCTVYFDQKGQPVIEHFEKTKMVGFDKEVSSSEFFSLLADRIEKLLPLSNSIAFCFSYAAEITPAQDGIVLSFSKEIKAPEVVGKPLGASLINALKKRGHDTSALQAIVINDTVATLLAGKVASKAHAYSAFVGFILGTGTNSAYSELSSKVTKVKDFPYDTHIINLESGGYAYPLSPLDRSFMKSTIDTEEHHLEKLVSGAYLGPYAHLLINTAIKEGLFTSDFASRFNEVKLLDIMRVRDFLEDKEGDLNQCIARCEDRETLKALLHNQLKRSAILCAINMSSTLLKTGKGKDPSQPVCINIDGTTYHKTPILKQYIQEALTSFLQQEQRYFTCVYIENSPIIGSAVAGLTRL
ncbi:MAG: hexokinase [Sphaerochaetaceae bacterium]